MQLRAFMHINIFSSSLEKTNPPMMESCTAGQLRAAWRWSAWKSSHWFRVCILLWGESHKLHLFTLNPCALSQQDELKHRYTTNADVMPWTCFSQSKLHICLRRSTDVRLLIHLFVMCSRQQTGQQHDLILASKWQCFQPISLWFKLALVLGLPDRF